MKAPVNKIIPFSNVDGPGNRCAIFFQSCPFACLYCHNPETIHMCHNCGACVATCPTKALHMEEEKVIWDPSLCVNCDTCIHRCAHHASPKIRDMSADELAAEVKKHRLFIRGVTLSGGECMNQAPFLEELVPKLKEMGLHILIDSNGFYEFSKAPYLLSLCDGVMLDVKAVDPIFHQQLCAHSNDTVLHNLDYLLEQGKLEEVRTVLLPHHEEQNKKTIAYVVKHIDNRCRYKLIAYRPYGVRAEGIQAFGNASLTKEQLKEYAQYAQELGCHSIHIV